MTLVHFGWLTAQRLFKESVSNDVRQVLQAEQLELMDREIVPFGFIDDGLNEHVEKDANGDLWSRDREQLYPFDDFKCRVIFFCPLNFTKWVSCAKDYNFGSRKNTFIFGYLI